MWSPTRVVVPLAALVFLSACGGRVTSAAPEQPMAAAAGASNGGGATASGGSASMNEPPDAAVQPPFETPWWLRARWQDNVGNPVTDQCKAGFTEADGLAAITSLGDQTGAVPVDAAGLLATIEQFRDLETREQAPSAKVVHVFATPEGQMGAISLIRVSSGLQFYYFVLTSDCRPVRLGFYTEHILETGCKRVVASPAPLWGIPELSTELRECYATSGYYAFQGSTTEDSCGRTPAVFSGAYSYRQPDATHADLVLVDTPFTELRGSSFGVRLEDQTWKAQAKGMGDCGPRLTQVWLEGDGQLRVEDDRDTCAVEGTQHCTWKMQSPRVYGPLN